MHILESRINYFGKKKKAKYLFEIFLKINCKEMKLMIQTKKFYKKFIKIINLQK